MTLNKLQQHIAALIAAGHGRKEVCVSKTTFVHNCENDGVTILPVHVADLEWIPLHDDNGGTATTKAGLERGSWRVVLSGNMYERSQSVKGEQP